jgi:hypothetical protein
LRSERALQLFRVEHRYQTISPQEACGQLCVGLTRLAAQLGEYGQLGTRGVYAGPQLVNIEPVDPQFVRHQVELEARVLSEVLEVSRSRERAGHVAVVQRRYGVHRKLIQLQLGVGEYGTLVQRLAGDVNDVSGPA